MEEVREWGEILQDFDGEMEGCLGADCPNNCCSEVAFDLSDGSELIASVWFYSDEERDYQLSQNPSYEDLGIETQEIEVIDNGRSQISVAIRGCFDEDTGCKLPMSRRPILCRLFPFVPGDFKEPISKYCSSYQEIYRRAKNRGILKKIYEVRKALGLRDNKLWARNIKRIIRGEDEKVILFSSTCAF